MIETLSLLENSDFPAICRGKLTTLQVNLGYVCNQQCLHCHVNAGPKRTEIMNKDTIDQVLRFLRASDVSLLDLTGGAPELNINFRYLVEKNPGTWHSSDGPLQSDYSKRIWPRGLSRVLGDPSG